MIIENFSLKNWNTFGIDVQAKLFASFHNEQELNELLETVKANHLPMLILGGGSNILFTDNFRGIVLHNAMKGIEVVEKNKEWVWVRAAAGENWHELVLWTIEKNFGGIENLSLIPGCVGASPMQNIGAYGVELKDVFEELEAIEIKTVTKKKFNKNDCQFGYRDSVFKHHEKNKFVITSVTLKLKNLNECTDYLFKTDYGDIKNQLASMQVKTLSLKAVSDAVVAIRRSKLPDPKQLGNAGSFFKNPLIDLHTFEKLKRDYPWAPSYPAEHQIKIPAAWLIEQCGWKGKRIGNTGAHAHQALVLVNYGNATGKEILDCALSIQKSVFEKFGILLEPEVNIY
jgi:UDP-N-acetylmuramate dehydrogenase